MDSATPAITAPVRATTRSSLQQRRLARTIPSRSPQGVLLYVVRDALAPAWTQSDSSRRLVDYVRGDVGVLQRARARLLTSARERITLCQTRALDTLDAAIDAITENRVSMGEGVSWGDGG